MKTALPKVLFTAAAILSLPVIGILTAGYSLDQYLQFPPRTHYVGHAPFSLPIFILLAGVLIAGLFPIVFRAVTAFRKMSPNRADRPACHFPHFPWWGWVGIVGGAVFWGLAWSRFSWFQQLQAHTFTPLWLCYILVINALSYRDKGDCLLTRRPRFFALLFPVSAGFWWGFEYFNRFVQNWHYMGADYGPISYFFLASISFSTVLPAVLSTRWWIQGMPWVQVGFKSWTPVRTRHPKLLAGITIVLSCAALSAIGIWPDYLFAMLWIAPLLIVVSIQSLADQPHVLSGITMGDWRDPVASASAALVCGFFWEMWNFGSLAHWQYSVPFVDRFAIFEMPVLGYAGYLPFGLECATVGMLLDRWYRNGANNTIYRKKT